TPERYLFRGGGWQVMTGDQQLFAFSHSKSLFPADLVELPFEAKEAYVDDYADAAGVAYAVIHELANQPVLTPAQAEELKAVLLKVRAVFECDVDVEWVHSDCVTLVQARPSTRPPLSALDAPAVGADAEAGQCASPGQVEAPVFVSVD